jgi:hypothetical protein
MSNILSPEFVVRRRVQQLPLSDLDHQRYGLVAGSSKGAKISTNQAKISALLIGFKFII